MNLEEVVDSLEARDPPTLIGIDLGIHTRCLIDSNCPKARELRTRLQENNVGLPEILEGYQQVTAPDLINWNDGGFQIDGRVTLKIAGQDIQLDLTQALESQLNAAAKTKIDDIRRQERRVRELGSSLYRRYLEEIARQRRSKTLPQLSFTTEDLLKYNIMVASEGDNYIFLSPASYRPEYITRDGIRSELTTEDKNVLRKEVAVKIVITRDNSFLSVTLLQFDGRKFGHYHGRHEDCWGAIPIPRLWNRSLRSLDILKIQLFDALVTINYNSLVMREPPDMPHIDQLLARSTQLGREGVIEGTTEPVGTRIGRAGTRWGR